MTKKQIKALLEENKLNNLIPHVITDGTKSDLIDALYLIFKANSEEYTISFESVPYSRGGVYKRHTSTLQSTQKWEIVTAEDGFCWIRTSRTSKSAACPAVVIPKFYTEKGKESHNAAVQQEIEKWTKKLLK